jgi:hypothetical protein
VSWLGWYKSDGKCWCAVQVKDGDRDNAVLRLVTKMIESTDMKLVETDKKPKEIG